MKIFIDLIRDTTYAQDIKSAVVNMGWEVTSDVNDNFDDGIALVASDHVVVMSSLVIRGNTLEEYSATKQILIEYLDSLT